LGRSFLSVFFKIQESTEQDSKAVELINAKTQFDIKYLDLLVLAGVNVLSPFGCTEERLKDYIVYEAKQSELEPLLITT